MDLTCCGIEYEFETPNHTWDFLNLLNIDYGSKKYFRVYYDVIYSNWSDDIIVLPTKIEPSYFHNLEKPLVIEELILHLYSENSIESEIETYDDYINSDCEMVLLIYDCAYLEIYCKDELLRERLFTLADNIPDTKVEWKYVETDGRTGMHV